MQREFKFEVPFFLIIATLFSFSSTSAMAKTQEVAAWIESVKPKNALTPDNAQSKAKIVVLRQGKPLVFNTSVLMAELKSGDQIFINDGHAYLNLINSTGPLRVTAAMAKKGGYKIDASPNSVWDNLVALVSDKIKPGQTQAVSASSRGKGPQDEKSYPSIPADQTDTPKLAAGERALHFRWQDGEPPYRLSLVRDDQVISKIEVSEGHEATLPKQALQPGNYKLVLKDKKGLVPDVHPLYGNAYVTENLILVAPADVPLMPAALAKATLPEETRQLLYADWLARQGKGEWSMEAIQHVFPYARDYEPAADWLRQWGGR